MCLNPLINGCKLIMKLFCGLGFSLHVLPSNQLSDKAYCPPVLVMLHHFHVAMVYWLERIFDILNHIHENAFPLYTISKIMLKLLINCL